MHNTQLVRLPQKQRALFKDVGIILEHHPPLCSYCKVCFSPSQTFCCSVRNPSRLPLLLNSGISGPPNRVENLSISGSDTVLDNPCQLTLFAAFYVMFSTTCRMAPLLADTQLLHEAKREPGRPGGRSHAYILTNLQKSSTLCKTTGRGCRI